MNSFQLAMENDQIELIHECHHSGNQTNRETINHHIVLQLNIVLSPKSQT